MIELLFRNEISRKRWRRFKSHKLGLISMWVLGFLLFFSFTAELWANSKPLVMSYKGETYFPVLKYYHPSVFGREDISQMDYKTLELSSQDWAVWPVIRWDPYDRNEKLDTLPSPPTASNPLGTDESGRDVARRRAW